jgi:tetratricopeptide (TPR) repeat protein
LFPLFAQAKVGKGKPTLALMRRMANYRQLEDAVVSARKDGDIDLEVKALTNFLAEFPDMADKQLRMAEIQQELGDAKRAFDHFQYVLHPKNGFSSLQSDPWVLFDYYALCETLGEDDEAQWVVGQLLDRSTPYYAALPQQPWATENMLKAAVYRIGSKGEDDRALAIVYAKKAVELWPAQPDMHLQLGDALLDDEQYQSAIAAYRSTIAVAEDQVIIDIARKRIEKAQSASKYGS